jgi:hypothetical protein
MRFVITSSRKNTVYMWKYDAEVLNNLIIREKR